jgi:hypothetical protein
MSHVLLWNHSFVATISSKLLVLNSWRYPRARPDLVLTMPSPIFLFVVSLPLLFRLLPEAYLEPYAWWDAKTLNDGQVGWRNMGWWEVGIAYDRWIELTQIDYR